MRCRGWVLNHKLDAFAIPTASRAMQGTGDLWLDGSSSNSGHESHMQQLPYLREIRDTATDTGACLSYSSLSLIF